MARPEVTGRAPADGTPVKRRKHKRARGPPTVAYTIMEFCDAHRISRSYYYELKKLGLGPDETRVLDKIIITGESAARWRRRLTADARRRDQAAAAAGATT